MNKNYEDGNIHCMDTPGSRLRALRKKRQLSQVQLSEMVGIDQSTISDIENGGGLSAEYMMRLCEALDTTPQYVMRGAPDVDEVIEQIRALVTPPQKPVIGNPDRTGKPLRKVAPAGHQQAENNFSEPAFTPALKKFFSSKKGGADGKSVQSAKGKKRHGDRS